MCSFAKIIWSFSNWIVHCSKALSKRWQSLQNWQPGQLHPPLLQATPQRPTSSQEPLPAPCQGLGSPGSNAIFNIAIILGCLVWDQTWREQTTGPEPASPARTTSTPALLFMVLWNVHSRMCKRICRRAWEHPLQSQSPSPQRPLPATPRHWQPSFPLKSTCFNTKDLSLGKLKINWWSSIRVVAWGAGGCRLVPRVQSADWGHFCCQLSGETEAVREEVGQRQDWQLPRDATSNQIGDITKFCPLWVVSSSYSEDKFD